MTYEEYKKQRLAQNNTQSNVSNTTKINTTPVNRYEEYKKQRLAQNSFNSSKNIQKSNNILENGQKMKINMTPTQAIIEKGKQLYQEPNMLKNIKPEMSYAGDVIDKKNILKKDSEYLQQIKKQKLEKMDQRTNELIAMTYKNKLANGVNLADDKNVITSLMGRQLGQKPSDKGNLLKVPENMKDNNRRFEDGYQFGDISKTALENLGDSAVAIGSTALEVPARLVKGILSVPEGIANAGASIVAGISDMVGQDDYANELRKRVAMGTPFVKTHAFMDNTINKLNSKSFSGNLLDSATEGIGQSAAQMAVGSAIGKFGEVPIKFGEHTLNMPTTAFVTGMGNSASETYAKADEQLEGIENATGKEKLQMALRILRGGTVEGVSEGLFGLLGVGGTDITEEFAKKAVAKAETAFEKQLTKIIIAGGGEAAEEFISYASNYLLDNYANKFGQLDFSENWNWDDVMQEMASAFISSGISQGVTSAVQINKATQNAIQLAEREQGRQLTTQEISEIRNSVANEVLGAREELENAQNSTNINENTPNIEQISQNNVQNVSDLEKSQQMSISDKQNRQATVTDEIQTFVENRNKIAPGLNVEMDNTLQANGVIIKKSDGTRTIKINPNSTEAYEFVAVHEMLHDLEGTQEYSELKRYVQDRATSHEEYERARQAITAQYENFYKANNLDMSKLDMDVETVNDMVTKALGNQQFLNELAGKKPNVFIKMYNWVKNVLFDGQNTGKTFNERRTDNKYLQELKKKFEIAYNTVYNNSNMQENYSIDGQSDLRNDVIIGNQNTVDINKKKSYNIINKSISNREKAQVSSEVRQWHKNTTNSIGYIDLSKDGYKSYIYIKNGDEVTTLLKVNGSEEFKNYVRRGVENGTFASTEGLNKSIETIKSEYRRYSNDSNVLPGRRTSNTDDTVSSGFTRQQSTNNTTDNIAKDNRNEQLENSKQSSFSLSKDNQGRTLSKEQQEYFKDSKVRDENDNLIPVYHGTQNGGFTEFHGYSYFTDSPDTARSYSGSIENITKYTLESGQRTTIGNYKGYLNLINPYIIDLKGAEWGEINIDSLNIPEIQQWINEVGVSTWNDNGKTFISTDDIISIVDAMNDSGKNYDGIILKNIRDNGMRANTNDNISTDYVAFKGKEQFKSIDNTTPTSNSDIRYSQSNGEWSKYLKENWDLMPNSKKTFGFPTNEQLQTMDNKKISESADVLNLRDNGKTEKTYKTNIERDSSIVEPKIKAIEKNDNAIYNETGGVENGRVEYKLSKLVERESKNIEETEKILKAQQQITEKSLTLQQKNTKNTAKEKYNKNIIYYDGNNVTSKGLTTKTNDIYIDNESSKAYGSDFVLGHEIAEDMIINHSNEVMEEFDNLIMEIQKSKSFTQMYKEYAQTLSSKQKQDLVFRLDKVAKEILCDINGGRNTNQSQDITEQIKKQLGEELYNKIVSSLDKYEKQIYKSSEEQGSFLMPTNVNNISLNDEMFDFYQQVSTNSNYSTTFKQRIGEMLEKTKSRAQFEKIKETVANYKTNLSSSEVDKRASEVRKYIDKQNSVISTKGLKMKNGDIINTIVNNVGMSKKYNHKTLNRIAGEISNLLYNGELTDAKIEQIVKDLGENVQTTIDEYYEANKELKKTIQKTKVYVSENVKKGFGDWNDFRRNSMGNVRLTNDSNALPIDTFYMELSDTYGDDVFPSNIVNASDQLQKIVEVSKQIKKTDMNFEKYVEQTYGKNAWEETARQLTDAIKRIRTELGKNGMYIETPESKGGIKKRSWTETTQNNDLVKNFLDVKELKYQVKTNSSTVKFANATLDNLGYDVAYENFASNMKAGRRMTANDIALGERLIQESIKNGEFEKATNLIYDVTILGTELGQAVQAMRLISRLSPEGQLAYLQKAVDRINAKRNVKKIAQKEYHNLEKYETKVENGVQTKLNDFKNNKSSNLDNYETKVENGIQTKIDTYDSKGIVIPVELRNNLLGAQTAEEIEKAVDRIKQSIADQMPVEFVEKANEWRYLSMLGNPKTHIRNILSNVAMRGTYASKNVIQRTIEQVTSPLLEERTRTFKKASEEVKKFAKQSAIDNRDAINGGGKLGIDQEIKAMRSVFKNETLEQLRKFNSKMLDAEDLFFSQSAYANNLAEYLTANGIRTQQDIDLNPDVVEKGINFATLEAQKTTFRQYSKLANLLNQAEGSNAFANLVIGGIVPFKKTPMNIAKTGASYSPLGLIETLTNETIKLKKGTITANEYIDRLSQGMTGTALTALGYVLASVGVLNGSSDDDKDKYNKLVGAKVPYTIKLGKTSFDLSWISPSAMPMFMGTELYEGLKNKDNKFDWNEIVNFTAKTIDPLSEMSMISGVNDAIKSYSNNDTSTGAISNIFKSSIESYLGQYFPTIASQFNKVVDKNIRSTKASKNSSFKDLESIVRQNSNKVPFASMLLEPSTDVWGNEKERNDNILLRTLDAFVNPGNITEENITDVDKEIMALYDASRNTDIVPKIPKDYFNSNGYKYEMSAKEYTRFKKKYGQTAYEELEKLFKTKEYRDMDSDKKEKAIEDVYDYAKEKARENYGFNAEDIIDKYGEKEGALRLINKETMPKYEKAKDAGIPLVDFYNAWVAQKNAEGKKKAKIKAINSAVDDDLTTYQKKALYRIFNVN